MDAKDRYEKYLEKYKETVRFDDYSASCVNSEFWYSSKPGDMIIFGPPKSGTTWMQQILHQIRTKGCDEQFESFHEQTWFLEHPKKAIKNLNLPQVSKPRIYKCHLEHGMLNLCDGVKCVVIVRNPYDVEYSWMKFRFRMYGHDEDVNDETESEFMLETHETDGRFDYFRIFQSWWPHRNDPNVFWIFYEDLNRNLKYFIEMLAAFMAVELNESEYERVHEMCTFEYMSKNEAKFRPDIVNEYNVTMGTADRWTPASIVRKDGGQIGQGEKRLGPKVRRTIDALWLKTLKSDFGFDNYNQIYEKFGLFSKCFEK